VINKQEPFLITYYAMNIYSILESKPHNPHYLKRYWKFINACTHKQDEYVEDHHICPKAKDLFPEHEHAEWNSKFLTARQHITAHVMLWKAYGGSQSSALNCMLGNFNSSTNIKLSGRIVPPAIKIRYLAKTREGAIEHRGKHIRGKSNYKDKDGNRFFLKTDDPMIKELGLVGNNTGMTHTQETRDKLSGPKTTRLYYGWPEIKVIHHDDPEHDEKVDALMRLGWTIDRTQYSYDEEKKHIQRGKDHQKKQTSAALTGTITYYYPNGMYYGRIPHESPIIKELGLVHLRSDKQNAQARERALLNAANPESQRKKSKTISQLRWFYDPITQEKKRLLECPEGWLEGRGNTTVCGGSTTWNDGVKNYRLMPGVEPDPSWVRGMAPQKRRLFNYTNGVDWIQRYSNEPIPEGYRIGKPK